MKKRARLSRRQAAIFAAVTTLVAVVLLIHIFASGTPTAFEAETGTVAGCAASVGDSSASGGQGVKFSACSTSDADPTNLDASGNTIPDSHYAIPSGAIYMATTGSDTNAGTQAAPVKTLNKAIGLVPSGGSIVVRGGTTASPAVYRDWYSSWNATLATATFGVLGKTVTIQAYPHEKAWFDGTDVEPAANWTSDAAGHWYMDWNTPSFCGTLPTATTSNYYSTSLSSQNIGATGSTINGPCVWKDSSLDPTNPMAGDPQMVFAGGTYEHEATSLSGATGGAFYYDWANKRIYISTNPATSTIELAARPMAMQLNGAGSKVLGLGFRRYATHVYANNSGVIYAGAASQTFENDAFTNNAGSTLTLAKPSQTVVNHSVFAFNGGGGIGGNGSRGTGVTDNTIISNNVLNNNNTELFWTGCSYSCAYSNIKLNNMVGFTIQNNIIENAKGSALGAWCDIACTGGKFIYNTVHGNGGGGILYEISDTGIIASNLVYNNGAAGIRVASAHTKIYNNTIVNNNTAGTYQGNLWIYDDPRSPSNPDTGNTGASAVGPDTTGLEYANNILSGSGRLNQYQGATGSTNTEPDTFFDLLDYNAYWQSGGSSQVLVHWVNAASGTTDYTSAGALSAAHPPLDAHSIDIAGGSEPFFTNAAAGDYTLRSGNQAGTGTAIPSDVLAALGLSSGSNVPKGAINWPGK
ncbi:right-handed parallel beta-helix repeat-containing protein [Candidatus Saccharibacteria bacterium]|nr:right-handed parallel beta-helix repeat-containing protein [Candidatus Saccharibacteria bacterium]